MTYEEYCNKVYMNKDYYLGLSVYYAKLDPDTYKIKIFEDEETLVFMYIYHTGFKILKRLFFIGVEGLFAEDVMKNQCVSSESTPDKYKLYNPSKDAIEFYNIPEDILNNYVVPLILTKEEKKSYLICEILSDNF